MNSFASEITEKSGQDLSRCYQCGKCSSGCPVVNWFEWPNHGIIRSIQLGEKEALLNSHALWLCVACETCGTRCPNDIHISKLMDAMRQMALAEGIKPAEPAVMAFHNSFVGSVEKFGRVHELSMLVNYKLKTRDFFTDVGAGMKLFMKGKIPLKPSHVKDKASVKNLFSQSELKG